MSNCRQCVDFEWCTEHGVCGLFKPKTMTNADRIRAMLDEELATHMACDAHICPYSMGAPKDWECRAGCEKCWLDWLKQEAE